MLNDKFRKAGLYRFAYQETAWYQSIRQETLQSKLGLMRNSLIVCALISSFLIGLAIFKNTWSYIPPYAIGFVLSVVALGFLLRCKRAKGLTPFALIAPFFVLVSCLYLPGSYNLSRLFLVLYPFFALRLRGAAKGSIWFAAYLAFFCLLFALSSLEVLPLWSIVTPVPNLLGQIVSSLLAFGFALSAELRHEKMIDRLSDRFVYNETTGLPGKDVLAHSIDKDSHYIFAIIKIENFSDLVALFGFEFSDTISQFASRKLLKYEKRFHYKAYHLKYNEYGLLIDRPHPSDVVDAAQYLGEIVKALEIESLPWERDRINLVYRVGGATVSPGDEASPFTKADVALKKAERSRTAIMIFDSDNTEKENAYDCVIKFSELVANRENDSFLPVFQPIFTGDGNSIAWYEALLRVRRNDGTYSSIYPYLDVARSTGFYHHLTDFMLRKTADAIVVYDIDVSINISIHDIVRPQFILLIDEVYAKIRDKRGRIIFELLESDELVELDKCMWFIDYVARYGFKIAIDDFGSGYSNYGTLINLPVDIVKIDGSLIKKINRDESAKILVEGIVSFCGKSNKKTVAEFVEDREVLDSLQSMKIDFLQGYYLSRPGTFSDSENPNASEATLSAHRSPSIAEETIPPA